jgi:hypothetical protein
MTHSTTYGATPTFDEEKGLHSSVTLIRPNNTTQYAINDAVGDINGSAILEFADMGPEGEDINLTSLTLEIDATSSTIGATTLHLYNASPTAIVDNGAWDFAPPDRGKYIDKIHIGKPIDEGSTLFASVDEINKQITLVSTSLFGILTTDTVFTPAASVVKTITLHAVEL